MRHSTRCISDRACKTAFGLAQEANRYLDSTAPWRTIASNRQAAARSLYTTLNVIAGLRTALYPYLPFTCTVLHGYLGAQGTVEEAGWRLAALEPGNQAGRPSAAVPQARSEHHRERGSTARRMSGLIDTHAHLHDRAFDSDRASVLARARAAGLAAIVTVGTDRVESEAAVALAEAESDIFATVGLHPHDAKDWDTHLRERLVALARRDAVVAIGEIGLDYYRLLSPQSAPAARLPRAAGKPRTSCHLPVVVHVRAADEPAASILAEWAPSATCGYPLGVLHCFAGDTALAMRYIQLGFPHLDRRARHLPQKRPDPLGSEQSSRWSLWSSRPTRPISHPSAGGGNAMSPSASSKRLVTSRSCAEPAATNCSLICGENARRLFRLPVASSTCGIPA